MTGLSGSAIDHSLHPESGGRSRAHQLIVTCAAALGALVTGAVIIWIVGREVTLLPVPLPMRPLAVTAIALMAVALALQDRTARSAVAARTACAAATLAIGNLALIGEGEYSSIRSAFSPMMDDRPLAKSSGVGFVAAGVALLMAPLKQKLFSVVARLCIAIVALIALHGFLSHAYGAASSDLRTSATIPFGTAVAVALMAIALAAQRADERPMSLMTGSSTNAIATRILIAACIFVPLLGGWLRVYGERLQLYTRVEGGAVHEAFTIVALVCLVTWSAARGAAYDRARVITHERLRRLIHAQDAIAGGTLQLSHVTELVVTRAQELVDADGAALVSVHANRLRYEAAQGKLASHPDWAAEPAEETFAGHAVLRNASRIESVSSRAVDGSLRDAAPSGYVAAVPISDGGSTIGALLLTRMEPFEEEQIDLLRLLSPVAAAALTHAREFQTSQAVVDEQSAELSTINQRFSGFMSHISAATFIKDASGHYIYGNSMLGTFLRHDPEAILGGRDEEFLAADVVEQFRDAERRILDGETVDQVIVTLFDAEDAPSWLLLRFLLEEPGGRRFVGGVAVDVTRQRRAEQRVRDLNESLERRVAERTEELTNANHELEAFSYSVSHDLRAPLRAVDGYARMIAEDYGERLDVEGRRFLGVIRSESRRMARLIDDLLSFSRLSRTSLSLSKVDLAALAAEVMAEVRASSPERTITFHCENVPEAYGDRTILRQVLVNLFSNAVKYAKPAGPVSVWFSGAELGNVSTYRVRDSGVGFDMKYVDKLFGVFQRLHAEDEFEGTGVGLAIVRRVVERHGGTCWAEGEVNVGAAFYFTLPSASVASGGVDNLLLEETSR